MPTSSLLALRIWGLLFLWLAHLHNKNNVYNQEISQRKLQLLIFISRVLVAFSWNLHHFQSFSSLQSGSGSISVPDRGGGGGGGGSLQKNCFSALPASVWSKNKGETQAPPLGPPLNFVCQGVDNDGRYICWLM